MGVNDVPIVGQPVAYGTGFIALVIVGSSRIVAVYFTTLAHEGGHMLTAFGSLRRLHGYRIHDDTSGLTEFAPRSWAFSHLVIGFAGYATPSLLGLAGTALIAAGNAFAVLLIAFLSSVLALFPARTGLAFVVPLVVAAGIAWAALAGGPFLLAAVASGVVWFLLLAGADDAFRLPSNGGDAAALAGMTVVVPGFVWKLVWIAIAVVSLYAGGRLLLVP